jgi:O-antigen chain-terminating methyltransferase
LLDVLSGTSPDYAVVAQKAAKPEQMGLFDAAFKKDYGLSLGTLAMQHEARIATAEATAQQAAARAQAAEVGLSAVHASFSWRITKPLRWLNRRVKASLSALSTSCSRLIAPIRRWCGNQVRLMRQQGLLSRLKAPVKKTVRTLARRGDAFLRDRPNLRCRCVNLTRRLGLYDPLRPLYWRCLGLHSVGNLRTVRRLDAASHLPADSLTPHARLIHTHLNAAIQHRREDRR